MSKSTGFALALLALAALTACPKAPPAPPPRPLTPEERLHKDVADLEARTRALLREQDEALWRSWTEGAPLDFGKTADTAKALYTPEAIKRIAALRATTTDPLDALALDELRLHFVSEYLARSTAAQRTALSHLEAATTFRVGDTEHPLRDLERLLARERNALNRRAAWSSAMTALTRLDVAYAERDLRTREVLEPFGYKSTLQFTTALRRIDDEALAKDAERLLSVTERPFRDVLQQLSAHELRLPLEEVRMRDLPRMFRSRDVDELFPKDQLLPRADATLEGLGIPRSTLPQLTVDATDSPKKNPLPFALALDVPHDVRLSLRPLPGLRAQSAYLHELGHALHAALTTEPRYPLAKLGMGAVAEAWSQLFELLVEDPVWLGRQTGLGGARLDRYLAASAAWDLYLLRRAAGRFLYSREVLAHPGADKKAAYRAAMTRALLVPIDDEDLARAALEEDPFLDSALQLEATFLSNQLLAQLKARFGPSWWEDKGAGDYLRGLWAHGNALDARELARAAGDDRLSPDALVLRLTSTLKVPIAVPASPDDADEE
ncbi:MAG: chromosome segregation protein SMC [Myxococcaceae bacterium]|nr:chromosome segregation protein SMC [Myxococcaceae bacterium]